MPKKVAFKFDENSKISVAELEALGFTFREVPLGDGRIVIIPVEPHLTPDAADTPKARAIKSGMPKGYKFPKKKCPRCLAEVAENRYVQHIRSKCVLR